VQLGRKEGDKLSAKLAWSSSFAVPMLADHRNTTSCILKLIVFYVLTALTDNGKFLLVARRFRNGANTEYIISYNSDDLYPGSNSGVGKLR
jgi:hypothetical protein